MDQEFAPVRSETKQRASAEIESLAPDSPAKPEVTDFGPFLRQEGRHPVLKSPRHLREELILRLRQELGVPSEQSHPGLGAAGRERSGPARDISLWMADLVQRMRHAG